MSVFCIRLSFLQNAPAKDAKDMEDSSLPSMNSTHWSLDVQNSGWIYTKKNKAVRAMYGKHGYTEVGIVPTELNGIPDVKLVLLEKGLGK